MMDKKMSLEDVRDWHRFCQQAAEADGHTKAAECHKELADAIDAELKARGEPVCYLRDDHPGECPALWEVCEEDDHGAFAVYTAPPAPKIEVTEAMVNKLACWMIAQFGECAAPVNHKERIAWCVRHARSALEVTLKETP